MARRFVAALSNVMETPATLSLGYPLSAACGFIAADPVTASELINISTGITSGVRLRYSTSVLRASSVNSAGTVQTASTTATIASGRWQHAVGTWASSTSRAVYLNGGNRATDVVSSVIDTCTRIVIGARYTSSALGVFADGVIAEVCVWNVALSIAEAEAVSRCFWLGLSPRNIQGSALVFYAPLYGRMPIELDRISLLHPVNSGSIFARHPPQFDVTLRSIWDVPAAAAGGNPWLYYAQQRVGAA